jgi:predicted porin
MNKAWIACIVLGGSTTCAYAQDTTQDAAASDGSVSHESAGGHNIAVFSGVPERARQANTGTDWTTPVRRSYGRGSQPAAAMGEGMVLGRQYNLEYLTRADVGDPFHTGTAGKASNLVNPSGTPVESGVRYYSTQIDHISTGGSWTVDTLGSNATADRAWGMTVGVDYGPLSLRAAHQNRHVAQVQLYNLTGSNMDAKNSILAANLRTRWGTAYAAYAANRGWGGSPLYNPDNPYGAGVASTSSTNSRDTIAGIAVPMTRSTTFLASYIHKNDRDLANRDANQFALGASYVVSRKTDFYAALSHTVNTNSTGILIGGAARPSGSSAVNVGMRHAF